MKLLLDQNLSFKLIPLILALFPGSKHVKDFDLTRDIAKRLLVEEHTIKEFIDHPEESLLDVE